MAGHEEAHPLARQSARLREGVTDPVQGQVITGAEFRVEDWWDRMTGKSWRDCDGNPACLQYAVRSARNGLPVDDEVVYGKVTGPDGWSYGHLVHVSELEPAG